MNEIAPNEITNSEITSGDELERVINLLSQLPGLGPRSARRAVLQLVKKKQSLFEPLTKAMERACEAVVSCNVCGNIDTINPCALCCDQTRNGETIVVVEGVADLWALERAAIGKFSYHVLGGVLSPLDNIGPKELTIELLRTRLENGKVKELILALNATVEGQTTIHYLKETFNEFEIKFTKLAHGVPIGGELDYLDEGTLNAAMSTRTSL